MENYPAIAFIIRHSKPLSLVLGIAPTVLLALLLNAGGFHWLWSIVVLAGVPLTYLLARGAIEMVTVVADMLLPK